MENAYHDPINNWVAVEWLGYFWYNEWALRLGFKFEMEVAVVFMINLEDFPHNKESLLRLLEKSRTSKLSHEEMAKWCWLFWSRWRSDEEDLFTKTDEETIDTAIEIGECWVDRPQNGSQIIIFDEEQIEKWISQLKEDRDKDK
ncbi:hypothetical protein HPY28_00265 [Brevibacillus sp. HB1.2]|uniref:hypothetical protein n=2 Tax=Brevibacillus TaxID=55080 RepID=UPI00156B5C75|nr:MULTISPECIES: hypothetical protein [unclassified Brevibacillus]NRS15590.1 hypothetical protein [Brevibacillus sp. HB1.4B]NTU18752.1 hypothetical protein [Brevibacillus sp. HB1.2]NTU29573.1 hypothetical protein [Brevibacillus sp. HB1.1]